MITSCTKYPVPNPAGAWTLGQITYSPGACAGSASAGTLTATSTAAGSVGSLTLDFSPFPTASNATYTAVAGASPSAYGQVAISATVGSSASALHYTSPGSTEIVYATVNSGEVTASSTGILMINTAAPFDSLYLSFNITQTQ